MMQFWKWLFSRGRVSKAPAQHTAGRFLPPAQVTRAFMDLRSVDPEYSVVETLDGEFRAVAEVSGYPLHARSDDDVVSFLGLLVDALNQFPREVVLIGHSAPGGLEGYAVSRRARSLLASGPIAALMKVQAEHAMQRTDEGYYRTSKQYLCAKGKTPQEAVRNLEAAASKLRAINVNVNRLVGEGLATAISDSWRPRLSQHSVLDFNGKDGDVLASIAYSPGNARVTRPRYVDLRLAAEEERATLSGNNRALQGGQKALPAHR